MRASLVPIALAVALCLGVAACGNDAPVPKPYTGPSESATPSGAPTLPAAARGTSDEAKIAFVRHYLDVLGYASHTGDVTTLVALGARGCQSCQGVINRIVKIHDAGGSVSGSGYGLSEPSVVSGVGGKPVVVATLTQRRQTTRYKANGTPTVFPASEVKAQFLLDQTQNGWNIAEWSRE